MSEKQRPNFDAALERQRAMLRTDAYWGIGRRVVRGPAACEYPDSTPPEIDDNKCNDADTDIRGVKLVTNADGSWDVIFDPAK